MIKMPITRNLTLGLIAVHGSFHLATFIGHLVPWSDGLNLGLHIGLLISGLFALAAVLYSLFQQPQEQQHPAE